ncbi:Laminin subunit alpha [Nymphon striatum]|nr:Laminin subunit alpha [Nymphon striatum]
MIIANYLVLVNIVLMHSNMGASQVLTPPYFNLAVGRRITASATCGVGVSESELYCKLVGANTDKQDNPNINLIQGQVCDYCNPDQPEMAHPPQYAIDGTERWWQSPPLSRGSQYNDVNLTIDLGQSSETNVFDIVTVGSTWPGISCCICVYQDGLTHQDLVCGYLKDPLMMEKHTSHGNILQKLKVIVYIHLARTLSSQLLLTDSVVCETKFSKVVPLEGGEASTFTFLLLSSFLHHIFNSVIFQYFYSVKDISIGGRCVCNGHADTCDITDPNDPYKLLCRCQHNTCGPQCENCCPGFVQKKWRRATAFNENECEPCNCFEHSNECTYDQQIDQDKLSIDIYGKFDGGGVCQSCQHNTQGINCNECKPGYYRPAGKQLNDTDVCQECECDYFYSTGSCAPITGKCECDPAFLSPDCDTCNVGYYGYPDCRPCDCHANGTTENICEVGGGQCPCKSNYEGINCDECKEGFYGFPDCKPCECNNVGSEDELCDIEFGKCKCRTNYGGRDCGECAVGWFNYPNCEFCNCDSAGTTNEVCNNETGTVPVCLSNFASKRCDRCSPGYYNYPKCTPCNCDFTGSIGVSCDDKGTCTCKRNFDDTNCNVCKEGFYNYPLCEECNCNPSGVLATFGGCGSLTDGLLCECKERVTGRICNTCKPLYWNLRANNPLGCEDCDCHKQGTIGGLNICDGITGQCMCKPNVQSRRCDTCLDGTYRLEEDNLFGCIKCGCNVGGSVHMNCDKTTGQCVCRPRVTGRTCDQPLTLHYFPALYQHQYELEDGKTPAGTAVRYSYDKSIFPNFSWKGYAVFSQLQNEVLIDVAIDKPSLYHIILHYVNIESKDENGEIRLIPETSGESAQEMSVIFKPSTNATLMRIRGPGGIPATFVLNPGRWKISVSADNVFIDYLVLLPSAFYEASLLQESVDIPCTIYNSDIPCRRYTYPDIDAFSTVRAKSGYVSEINDTKRTVKLFVDQTILDEIGSGPMAHLNINQTFVRMDLELKGGKPQVFLILYYSPTQHVTPNATVKVDVELKTKDKVFDGHAILYHCEYNVLCRQAIADPDGRVAIHETSDMVNFKISTDSNTTDLLIHSVIAIPLDEWNEDYIVPRSMCIQVDGKCRNTSSYEFIPNSIKVEFETSEHRVSATRLPGELHDNINVKLIELANNDTSVDIHGSVQSERNYVFVIHYYQPYHPKFDVDVLIQNGQFYEATLPIQFCPSNTGCRSILKKKLDGDFNFKIIKNFMLSIINGADKPLWVDYVLAIPSTEYNEEMLLEKSEDRAGKFISDCSQDNFRLSLNASRFCKDSTFSLTSEYNNGALPCACNTDGSLSFECDQFGGQCQCRQNVIGRTCSECQTGFYGFPSCRPCSCPSTALCHPTTGQCICPARVTGAQCDTCKPFTYGFDPIIGCEECDCNRDGVKDQNMQCNLLTGKCSCKPNVIGRRCNQCAAGYWAFPYCRLCECDSRGTTEEICDQTTSQCFCKDNVYGPSCDKCLAGTFHLEERNPLGCTKCFCFGATDRCRSALMYRVQIIEYENWNHSSLNFDSANVQAVEDVNITMEMDKAIIKAQLPPKMPEGTFFYISAPEAYLGNRVTSYGGMLRYTVSYILDESSIGGSVIGPDVVLIGNNMTIIHEHLEQPSGNDPFRPEIPLYEYEFTHISGRPVSREQFMIVLSALEKLYIRGLYYQPTSEVQISEIMLDTAEKGPIADAPQALEVEHCQCPRNYIGASCEECAPGYYRSRTGPHLGFCVPCQCNGHANTCDVHTGVCIDCQHHATGDHCEQCIGGYYGNATRGTVHDCIICVCPLPIPSNNFAESCEVSPSGKEIRCHCKPEYYGPRCDVCSAGYYGRPDLVGGSCQPCNCSGNINVTNPASCDSQTGDCMLCLHNTAGSACNYCSAGFYGDAIINKDCKHCSCNKCGTEECDNQLGVCKCKPGVIGSDCNKCAPEHWGHESCLGCRSCSCGIAAYDKQCDIQSGQCQCKPGVTGLRCDICEPGYWNYNEQGCRRKFFLYFIYSAGAVCDPNTGQCQCLPGVIGGKCDHCPYRWVLITGQGCQQCGPCIHSLLDGTDEIANILDPALAELEGASTSYFAYKRLDNVNATIDELRPLVDELVADPNKLDLGPLKDSAKSLEVESEKVSEEIEAVGEKVVSVSKSSDVTLKDALKIEELILESIKKSFNIVDGISKLAFGLEDEKAFADLDKLIEEAERILMEINETDLSEQKGHSLNESTYAQQLMEEVLEFGLRSVENTNYSAKLVIQIERVHTLLTQLANYTNEATIVTNLIIDINDANQKSSVMEANEKINSLFESTETMLNEGMRLNGEASIFLQNASIAYDNMNESSLILELDTEKLSNLTLSMVSEMNETRMAVNESINHAKMLESQSNIIKQFICVFIFVFDSLLDDSKDTSKLAVKAATVHQAIKTAIDDAMNASLSAIDASGMTQDISDGDSLRASKSKNISVTLINEAKVAAKKVEGGMFSLQSCFNFAKAILIQIMYYKYEPPRYAWVVGVYLLITLKSAKSSAEILRTSLTKSSNRLYLFKSEFKELPKQSKDDANTAINVSTAANDQASAAKSSIENILEKLPNDESLSETIQSDSVDANDGIKRAQTLVDRVTGRVPELIKLSNKNGGTVKRIKLKNADIVDKIAALKRKVALARDQAKRIEIGAKFHGNTSIKLRNPENLQQAATYTQTSMYVRTSQPDGLLMYLGNEVGTHNRVKRMLTDDFMALEISGGKVILTIDLGSGNGQVTNSKYITDGQWHKIEVERTGNTASLIVKTENEPDSVENIVLQGTNIMFNLEQKVSKFYVGGIPETAKIQDVIKTRYFEGDIEELVFGKNLQGFWNFVTAVGHIDGSIERDQLVILQKSNGMKFDGTGYTILKGNAQEVLQQTNIILNFKSYAKNVLIFFIAKAAKTSNFLAIEMQDGFVQMKFDLGEGMANLSSPKRYNDGEWHKIEISRVDREAILIIDKDEVASGITPGTNDQLDVEDNIYVGGYPGKHGHREIEENSFEGCIKDFYFGALLYDLNQNVESLGGVGGCPASVSSHSTFIARTVSFTEDVPGYVAMPNKDIKSFLQLSFKFKTVEPSGLLFYTANHDQSSSFAVSLLDGSVVVRSRPGGEVQTSTDTLYNDSEWHYIMITKAEKKLRIDVNDFSFVVQELSEAAAIENTTPLYFGGVPADYEINLSTAASVKSYVGCLGDATVNGKFQNFADTLDRPGASLASCPLGGPVVLPSNTTYPPHIEEESAGEEVTTSTYATTPEEEEEVETTTDVSIPPEVTTSEGGQCVLPVEPHEDLDVNEESGFRLGDKPDSRLEYDNVQRNIRDKSEFSMQFKTGADSGILFYVVGSEYIDYIALFLLEGRVYYQFDCGSGAAVIVSNEDTYNDSEWHKVVFSREKRRGKLIVDETDVNEGSTIGVAKWINIKAPFSFGGLNPEIEQYVKRKLKGVTNVLNGCIKDIRQGQFIMDQPSRQISISKCSDKVEPGSFFSSNGGYIQMYDKFKVGFDLDIIMNIKPRNLSGVLLSIHGSRGDYLVLQLLDGNIKFTVNNGAGPIAVSYFPPEDHYLCDGQWHRLRAVKTKNIVTLSVDGMFAGPGLGVPGISSTDTNDPLYLGGIPESENLPKGVETSEQYAGCISNIEFDDKKETLRKARVFGDVTFSSCPTI